MNPDLSPFLESTDLIDWRQPDVLALAQTLATGAGGREDVARRCFEWVRDRILHTVDHGLAVVTCRASDVLREGTGFCYAKSHLLAALLRANGIPAGFRYQRLRLDTPGRFCLHGLNAIWLDSIGWYDIDPRGNRPGINAQFDPPHPCLAFAPTEDGERMLDGLYSAPLDIVVSALQRHTTCAELLENLPDLA